MKNLISNIFLFLTILLVFLSSIFFAILFKDKDTAGYLQRNKENWAALIEFPGDSSVYHQLYIKGNYNYLVFACTKYKRIAHACVSFIKTDSSYIICQKINEKGLEIFKKDWDLVCILKEKK